MPLRFEWVLPVVMMFAIWNCHFHKPGPTCIRLNSTPLRFICSPPIRHSIKLGGHEGQVLFKKEQVKETAAAGVGLLIEGTA